jgi:hypothetical protein
MTLSGHWLRHRAALDINLVGRITSVVSTPIHRRQACVDERSGRHYQREWVRKRGAEIQKQRVGGQQFDPYPPNISLRSRSPSIAVDAADQHLAVTVNLHERVIAVGTDLVAHHFFGPVWLTADFWSLTLYDALTASGLDNGQPFPSLASFDKPEANADGSIDFYLGPTAPPGKEKNWKRTVPGKAISPFSGSMARPNPSSTRPGSPATSKR